MKHFPVFLDLKDRHCLVIGGGSVATRKINNLLKANANVVVISPQISEELKQFGDGDKITVIEREFELSDIALAFLVVAATDDSEVNAQIAKQANNANTMVNVADNAKLCSFIFPSVLDRSPVTIAVSTGGASPVLARQLRMKLETMIPSACGRLAGITEEYREKVKQHFPKQEQRKHF